MGKPGSTLHDSSISVVEMAVWLERPGSSRVGLNRQLQFQYVRSDIVVSHGVGSETFQTRSPLLHLAHSGSRWGATGRVQISDHLAGSHSP